MLNKPIKNEYFVEGMHCAACEFLIENELKDLPNVISVKANLKKETVIVESSHEIEVQDLSKYVEEAGYKITKEKAQKNVEIDAQELVKALIIALLIFGAFIAIQKLGFIQLFNFEKTTLPVVFGIGILASLSSCMAVVGGLVLSLSSKYAKNKQTLPLIVFHASRVIGFFILGGLIGALGSAFVLTSANSVVLNLILFLLMTSMGLSLLEIPAINNLFSIRMPKIFGTKLMQFNKTESGSSSLLFPAILGVGTFFLPCGFTQSMQIFALSKGNFIDGALTMLIFSLGTLPVLASISVISNKYAQNINKGLFFKTAGMLVVLFALINLIGALAGAGIIPPILNF